MRRTLSRERLASERREWKRLWGAALLVAAVLALAAACGGSTTSGTDAGTDSGGAGEAATTADAGSDGAEPSTGAEASGSAFEGLEGEVLVHDSNGGAVTEAVAESIFANFSELTGVSVVTDFNPTVTKLLASIDAGRVPWSVIEVSTLADIHQLVARDALQPLDTSVVPVDKLPEGSYNEYAIPRELYGKVLTWNTDKWPVSGEHPSTMADLFDVDKFPGKRCLYKYPNDGWTLEAALLADGVPADQLYPLDVERALSKLDTIKDDIVWWESGAESIQYLTNGSCDLGITWSGRPFDAINTDGAPLAITWAESGYASGYFAVPKEAPNPKAGMALVGFWLEDKQGQIDFVSKIPYPTPIEGIELTDYPSNVQPFLPAGANLEQSTLEDADYYAENIDELVKRFTAWLSE